MGNVKVQSVNASRRVAASVTDCDLVRDFIYHRDIDVSGVDIQYFLRSDKGSGGTWGIRVFVRGMVSGVDGKFVSCIEIIDISSQPLWLRILVDSECTGELAYKQRLS
jgi:hypothetical protein